TAHNHGFAVAFPGPEGASGAGPARGGGRAGSPYGPVEVSHRCLNDGVVEGLRCLDVPAFSVQYHPEAAAGPHDAGYLFDPFAEAVAERESAAASRVGEGA